MNMSQLIEHLSEQTGCQRNDSEQVVRIFFSSIKRAIAHEDKVEIRGFGSFNLKKYRGYTGRNPKNGEAVEVKEKILPIFRTGKDLRLSLIHISEHTRQEASGDAVVWV